MISSPKFGFQGFEAQSPIAHSFDEISSINPTEQKLEGSEQQINVQSIFQNKPLQDSIQAFDLSNNEQQAQVPEFFKKLDFKIPVQPTTTDTIKQNLFDTSNNLFSTLQFNKLTITKREEEGDSHRLKELIDIAPRMPAIDLLKQENKPLRPLLRTQQQQPKELSLPPWSSMPIDQGQEQSEKPKTPQRFFLEQQDETQDIQEKPQTPQREFLEQNMLPTIQEKPKTPQRDFLEYQDITQNESQESQEKPKTPQRDFFEQQVFPQNNIFEKPKTSQLDLLQQQIFTPTEQSIGFITKESIPNIPIKNLFTITPNSINEQVSLSETSQTTFNFPIQTCIGPQGIRDEPVPEFGSPEQNQSLKIFIESESQQGSFGSPSMHTQETQKFVIKIDDELETIKNQKPAVEFQSAIIQNDIHSFMDKDSFAAEPIQFESSNSSQSIIQQLMPQNTYYSRQFDDLENIIPNNSPICDRHFINQKVDFDEKPAKTAVLLLKASTLKITLVKEIIKFKLIEKSDKSSDTFTKQERLIMKLKDQYLALMEQLNEQVEVKKYKIDRTDEVKQKKLYFDNVDNQEQLNNDFENDFNIQEKFDVESRIIEQSQDLNETIKITPHRKVSPSPQKSILTNTIKPHNHVRAVDLIKPDLAIQQEMMLGQMHYISVKNQLDTFKQNLTAFKEDHVSANNASIMDIISPPTLFNHQQIPNLFPMQQSYGLGQSQPINVFQQQQYQYPQQNMYYSQQNQQNPFQQGNIFQQPTSNNIFQQPTSNNIFQPTSNNIFQPTSNNIFQPQQNQYQGNVFQQQQNIQRNIFQPAQNNQPNIFQQQQGNIFQKPTNQINQQRSQSPNFFASMGQQKQQVNPYPNVSPYNVFQQPNIAQIPTQQVIRNAQQPFQQNTQQNIFQPQNQPIIPITQQQNPFQPQAANPFQPQQFTPQTQQNIFQNPQNPYTQQYNDVNKNSKGNQASGAKTVSFSGTSQVYNEPYPNSYNPQNATNRPGTPVKSNSRYNTRSRQI